MSMFELYALFVLLPAIGTIGGTVSFISGVAICILCFVYMVSSEHELDQFGHKIKTTLRVFVPIFTVAILLSLAPSERQVKFLAGGYVVTNVEGISELPENIVESANTFLKSITDEQEK